MLKILLITLVLWVMAGCMPQSETIINTDNCHPTEQFNTLTRQCETLVDQVPIPTLMTKAIYEDSGANTVSLGYYDADNEPATACQVLTYGFGINLFPPTSCTCTSGICSVPVTPNSNYYGSTFFTYRVLDRNGYSDTQRVAVTVVSVNDAPVPAAAMPFSIEETGSAKYGDVPQAFDEETPIAANLIYSLLTTPRYVTIEDFETGYFKYEPKGSDNTHDDLLEELIYQVCDIEVPQKCATGTINMKVVSVNSPPKSSFFLSTIPILEDTAASITIPVATDIEGDTILYLVSSAPVHGTLSSCLDTNGATSGIRTCTYTPDADYAGDDGDSFEYQVCDDWSGNGFLDDCSDPPITVQISITPVNDPPVALSATYGTNEDTIISNYLTATDVDSDSADLKYYIITHPITASVTHSGTETHFTFLPGAEENSDSLIAGDENFTFIVCDEEDACSAPATITIAINPVEDAPTIILPSSIDSGTNPEVIMNEGGAFNLIGIKVDEGGASDEDGQTLEIAVVVSDYDTATDYTQILPANDPDYNSYISVRYGGLEVGAAGTYPLGETTGVPNYESLGDAGGNEKDLDISLTPVAGRSGTVQVEIFLRETIVVPFSEIEVSQKFRFTVNAVTALHGGWSHIKAVGVKRDSAGNVTSVKRDSSGNSSIDATTGDFVKRDYPQIELQWNAFILASTDDGIVGTASWEIFRREGDEQYDWTNPIGKISNPGTRSYIDPLDNIRDEDFPKVGTVYYYTVRPVASTNGLPVPTQEVFSEVRIIAPPDNMVFVHRWMVNQEVCGKMHMNMTNSLVDPSRNFRCEFTGPGSDSTDDAYYDVGADFLVDMQEAGCPYDWAGSGAPAGTLGSDGELYYDRSSGDCYLKNSIAPDWHKMSNATYDLPTTNTASIADNTRKSGQAPLVNITADNAADICRKRSSAIVTDGSTLLSGMNSYLPSRKIQIAYSAWSSLTVDATITETEAGTQLNNSSKCNTSSANGISSGFTDATNINTDDNYYYAIPGTVSSGIRSIYTGSEEFGSNGFTYLCESRYGVQDPYGNVAEWVSDVMDCHSTAFKCAPVDTRAVDRWDTIIPSSDWNGYSNDQAGAGGVDEGEGSCVDSDDDGACDDYLQSWTLSTEDNYSIFFNVPMGLTYSGNYTGYDTILSIGSGAGIKTDQLHGDNVVYNMEANDNSGQNSNIATGGSYLSGTTAGRYTMELVPQQNPAAKRNDIGFRCVVPIQSADYWDIEHKLTYTYD